MGRTGNNAAFCQTPWSFSNLNLFHLFLNFYFGIFRHLSAADLYGVSSRIDLDYESLKTPLFSAGETCPGFLNSLL